MANDQRKAIALEYLRRLDHLRQKGSNQNGA